MRKFLNILLLWVAIFVIGTAQSHSQQTVQGSVKSGKNALAGVAVTDGYNVVVTDKDGDYRLQTDPRSRFIYISTPAGYIPGIVNGLVRFYKPLNGTAGFDFSLDKKDTDDTRHGFIAVADPQVLNEYEIEMMAAGVADIAATVADNPGFTFHGMGCGDIVFDRLHLYDGFNAAMLGSGIPFYHSIGNHDMNYTNRTYETSHQTFEDVFGPAWYSYNVGKIHYVVLNDVFYIGRGGYYIGYLDEAQLRWLEQDLALLPSGSTVVVTMHIPSTVAKKDRDRFSFDDINNVLTNKEALYSVLEGYNAHIVSGHYHTTANCEILNDLYEHNIAALSGAWWQGPVCTDGTPSGYGVFLCDGEDIEWYYKSVGYPRDYQLKVYIGNDDDGQPHVIANVWNVDSAWKVELFENGEYSGEMERFETLDPDANALYADKDKLGHKWIEPTPADHFFRGTLSPRAKTVEVVATDRFGNVSRATLALDSESSTEF